MATDRELFDKAFGPDKRPSIDAAGRAAIKAAMATIPEGKQAALVVIATEQEARVHYARKFGADWKVALDGGRKWSGEVDGMVSVIGAW